MMIHEKSAHETYQTDHEIGNYENPDNCYWVMLYHVDRTVDVLLNQIKSKVYNKRLHFH